MRPVKNDLCNAVLKAEGCKDLPVRREEYRVVGGDRDMPAVVKWSTWWAVSDDEVIQIERAIRNGATPLVRLDVFADGHPPVLAQVEPLYPDDVVSDEPPNAIEPAGGEWERA